MSEKVQQEKLVDYIKLVQKIDIPNKDVKDFLETLIVLSLEDLEEDKNVWLEKWK